ncbi:MAG: phosphate uptake regulator PhoU [Nitrososphaerales archaeon]
MLSADTNREEKVRIKLIKKDSFDTQREDDVRLENEDESLDEEEKASENLDQRSFERILQRSGRGSVAVILPHPWLDNGHLKVHDKITLRWQTDGSLRIATMRQSDAHTVFLIDSNQGKLPHGYGRSLISAYIEGYNAMRISSNVELTKEQHDDVLAHASKLIGLAVVGENRDNIMIRCYLDPFKNDISQLFVRIYSLSSAMLKYSLDALVNSNLDAADRVKKLDGEVDKIYYLILRQLFTAVRSPIIAESLHIERPLNIVGDRAVAQLIEDIGDACHNSCTKLITFSRMTSLPKELQPKAQELSEKLCQLYDRTFRAYSLLDCRAANSVIDDCRSFEKAVEEFERASEENTTGVLKYTLTGEFELVVRHCRSIAEIAFNRAIGLDSENVRLEEKEPLI